LRFDAQGAGGRSLGSRNDEINVVAATTASSRFDTGKSSVGGARRMAARNWTRPPDDKFDRDEATER